MNSSRFSIKYRYIYIIVSIFLMLSLIIFLFMKRAHAELVPNKEVKIDSQKTKYVDGGYIAGASINFKGGWRLVKKAKWVDYGKANLELNIKTNPKYSSKKRDLIIVLDDTNNANVPGGNFDILKNEISKVTEDYLNNEFGSVALISFSDNYNILQEFTNDYEELETKINNLNQSNSKDVSYYMGLKGVESLLSNYQQVDDTQINVVFISGVAPTKDVSLEIGEAEYLRSLYTNLTINTIEYSAYSRGVPWTVNSSEKSLKKIADEHYNLSIDKSNRTVDGDELYYATNVRLSYDRLDITEYINNDYFTVDDVDNIKAKVGKVSITYENGKQKIYWKMDKGEYITGRNSLDGGDIINITLKLNDNLLDKGGIYPTSSKSIIMSSLEGVSDENVNSTSTTILPDNFKVIYDDNKPSDCIVHNLPNPEYHSVFATVNITENEPTCEGYIFNGWKILNDNLTIINDDTFIMPEDNVYVRAEWSKLSIKKSMDGEINKARTLYDVMAEKAIPDNIDSTYVHNNYKNSNYEDVHYTGILYSKASSYSYYDEEDNGKGVYLYTASSNEKYPLYFYRGRVEDNNVIFGNYCWKAVRTTENGGVKLIYNGNKTGLNSCKNVTYNYISQPPFYANNAAHNGSSGYMYGKVYDIGINIRNLITESSSLYPFSGLSGASFSSYNSNTNIHPYGIRSYSKTLSYRTEGYIENPSGIHPANRYVLENYFTFNQSNVPSNYSYNGKNLPYNVQLSQNGGISHDDGKVYTCKTVSTSDDFKTSECLTVEFILQYMNNIKVAITLENGKMLEDYLYNIYVGDGFIKNEDGTYTLTNPVAYTNLEMYDKVYDFDSIKGKYYCLNYGTTCQNADKIARITSTTPDKNPYGFKGVLVSNDYILSKNVSYSDDKYKLKNTIKVSDLLLNGKKDVDQYIYSCRSTLDECSSVYVSTKDNNILLNDGNDLEGAIANMRTNTNNSIPKMILDGWYNSTIEQSGLSKYIEDTIYCNDRSNNIDKNSKYIEYKYTGADLEYRPTLTCEKIDSFTVSSDIGNGALTFPVGMLTYDEMVLAGAQNYKNNTYLNSGNSWWTMSPASANTVFTNLSSSISSSSTSIQTVTNTYDKIGIRPVISIKPDISINGGDGTEDNPYVFKLD